MQGRKYINWVETGLEVLGIQKGDFDDFTVPVNNTLLCHVFLAADTQLCVLMTTEV